MSSIGESATRCVAHRARGKRNQNKQLVRSANSLILGYALNIIVNTSCSLDWSTGESSSALCGYYSAYSFGQQRHLLYFRVLWSYTLIFSSCFCCWGSLAQFYLDDFTRGHLIPRLVSTPGVLHNSLRQFSSRSPLKLFSDCLPSPICIRVCLPQLST